MHDTNGRRMVRSSVSSSVSNNGIKLKRCASLPAQKRNVPYMSSKETENLKLQLESSVESLGEYITLRCLYEIFLLNLSGALHFFIDCNKNK